MSNVKTNRHSNKSNKNNSLVVLGANNNLSEVNDVSPQGVKPKNYHKSQGIRNKRPDSASSLEILPPENELSRPRVSQEKASKDAVRPNSSRKQRRAPPVHRPDSAPRRTPTPSKQVSLQVVQRKGEREWNENESVTYSRPSSSMSAVSSSFVSLSVDEESLSSLQTDSDVTDSAVSLSSATSSVLSSDTLVGAVGGKDVSETSNVNGDIPAKNKDADIEDSDEFDTDLEDGEESSDSEEEEETHAPNELFMEFLSCVMEQDYENAKKLCSMILMYEPENQEALKFQTLIDEKIEMDEESTDESDDSDEDDGSTDSDDDSSDGSSDEDETSSDEEQPITTDSGVSSATELP